MDNTQQDTKKTILDYDIWNVLALDISDEDKQSMYDDFIEAAWMDLIETGLKEIVGETEYNELYGSLKEQNLNLQEFIQAIKDTFISRSLDIDNELNKSLSKVLQEFIEDQIDFLEKRVKAIKDATERDVKLSLIQTLKELFTNSQWDQMGDIFKKIDGYQLPESLVLHL